METFSTKFRAGSLHLNALVTEYDHHQKFKVELVTEEPQPILLTRSVKGEWLVTERGSRNFSDVALQQLTQAIETQLSKIYGVNSMLVLTDFSDSAKNAGKYAAALAHQLKTEKVMLYHSYESLALIPNAFAPVSESLLESPEKSLEMMSEQKMDLEKLAPDYAEIEIHTDERNLINAVNALVGQRQAGLVVAGIKGKNSLERILVGSNTVDLAKDCLAPLLIVPPRATFKPIKNIVFACDLKKVSKSTPVLPIKAFVKALGARLIILNVDDDRKRFDPDTIEEMTHLHELWDDQKPEYHYIEHEDTVRGIMEFASQADAELVITIPKQYGFFENIFHRSMTQKLAYHSHLPLLLFKEDL